MAKFIPIIATFIVGGLGALGAEGMAPLVVTTSVTALVTYAATEWSRRQPAPVKK